MEPITNWLSNYGPTILAILGALYAAARIIVAWVKTPTYGADHEPCAELMKSLHPIVAKIGGLLGLDLTQGRTEKPETYKRNTKSTSCLLIAVVLASILIATTVGCSMLGETGGMGGQGLRIVADSGSTIDNLTVNISDGGTDVRGDAKSEPLIDVKDVPNKTVTPTAESGDAADEASPAETSKAEETSDAPTTQEASGA